MAHQAYTKPLVFSGYHGNNIVVSDNGFLSEGQYLTAHGQFITQRPLGHNESFGLEFRGSGIVKLNTFQYRRQAVEWVLSKQPLSKGCKRLKIKCLASYNLVASETENRVRMESQHRSKTEAFLLDKGPEATLAFDIECGDVVVSIFNTSSNVAFDTSYHSPHIEITISQRMSTASLQHYNPSALCSLDNTPLIPGTIFELEVSHSGQSKDSGSYIRLCVSQMRSPYVNDEEIQCSATPTSPAVTGKRICLVNGDSEVLQVTVVPQGIVVNRGNKAGVEKLACPITTNDTLWFELHKASLRVSKLLDCDISNTEDASFLPEPPLPAVCCRRTHKNASMLVPSGCPEEASVETCFSETLSVVRERNIPAFSHNFASYVSPDSLSAHCAGAADPKYILNTRTTDIMQCDLLCDLLADSTAFAPPRPYLITMSSLDSYADSRISDLNSLQSTNINPDGKETIYEKPGSIWLHSKQIPGHLGNDLPADNNNSKNVSDAKETGRYLALLPQTPQTTVLAPPEPEAPPQIRRQNMYTRCSESGHYMKISNYVLKIKDDYTDDSKNEVRNPRLDVLRGCRTIEMNKYDPSTFLQTFQGNPAASVHALHSYKVHRYDDNISPDSINTKNRSVSHSTYRYNVPPNIPIGNIASSTMSDAAVVNFEVDTRRSVRDKPRCQQFPNSFRRRCLYMLKKPELPQSETVTNYFSDAPVVNTNSRAVESHAKGSVITAPSKDRLNRDTSSFYKSNSSTSVKHDVTNYLASLKLRAPSTKSRSISNASDRVKNTIIRHSRSFSFVRLHCKDKTQSVKVLAQPLNPIPPQ